MRLGFHTSQLIEYTVEPNPDAGDDNDKNAPPQKLAFAFSTAEVVVLGWRLSHLADKLQENDLAAVRVLAKRYAEVDRSKPFVASITMIPHCQRVNGACSVSRVAWQGELRPTKTSVGCLSSLRRHPA